MIKASTFAFLRELSANNNKEWFDAHRDVYAAEKERFEAFISHIMQLMVPLEPMLEGQHAKDAIFRIFRDVRFGKDKTPYKNHFSAYISRGGRKWEGAGYYLQVQPGASFIAAGIWQPPPALLKAVRQEIDYDLEGFRQIIQQPAFKKAYPKLEGESLQKLPAGYTVDNPAAAFLKMKSFMASHALTDKELIAADSGEKLLQNMKIIKPLVDFLNRAMD